MDFWSLEVCMSKYEVLAIKVNVDFSHARPPELTYSPVI